MTRTIRKYAPRKFKRGDEKLVEQITKKKRCIEKNCRGKIRPVPSYDAGSQSGVGRPSKPHEKYGGTKFYECMKCHAFYEVPFHLQ